MKTLVVIPTYNERGTIVQLIHDICVTIACDVLVVDDASPDGTAAAVRELQASSDAIHLLERPQKKGLGTAYVAGFTWALEKDYDVIIQMDGDFSHDPKYLPSFMDIIQGHDVVVGSRYVPGGGLENWRWHRRLLSRVANQYANTIIRHKDPRYVVHDSTGGYKCWRASVLRTLPLSEVQSDGYSFQLEMNWLAVQHGFSPYELPIRFRDRAAGASKISKSVIAEAAFLPWRLKKHHPPE